MSRHCPAKAETGTQRWRADAAAGSARALSAWASAELEALEQGGQIPSGSGDGQMGTAGGVFCSEGS